MCFVNEKMNKLVFVRNDCARVFFMNDFLCILNPDDTLEQYDLHLLRRDMGTNKLYFKGCDKDLDFVLSQFGDKPTIYRHQHKTWSLEGFLQYIESNLVGI